MKDDNIVTSTHLNNGTVPANIATPSGVTSDQILASSQPENVTLPPEQLEITEEPRSNIKISFLLLALFLSLFISALDATIVSTAVPVITHELNSAVGYTWIGASYLIANAIACPITAKLSDIWGRKSLMLGSVALFFIASTVCARANSMDALISGRVMQGIAGGSIILLVHIVISDVFSMRQRSLFMGLTEGIWATAGGIGPPLGGVFSSFSWRWCFYINLPICAIAFILLVFFLDVKHEKTSFRTGIKAIDWIGLSFFLAFTLMVLLGLNFGGSIFPWDSAKVLCLLIIGVAMLAAFIYSEAKLARYPLIPLSIFKDPSNLGAFGVATFHGLAFMPGEYYVPLYLQACKGLSPLRSGVLLVPLVVATAGTGVLTGVIIHKTGHFRELMWVGSAILALGNGLAISWTADTTIPQFIGMTIVFGIGSGMLFEPPLIALQTRVPQNQMASATSTFTFIRGIAVAISVVIGGVVFQNSMDGLSGNLVKAGLSDEMLQALKGKNAAANVELSKTVQNLAQQGVIRETFALAMRNMWIMYTVLAFLCLISSIFVGKSQLSHDHTETITGIRDEKEQKEVAETGTEVR